MSAQDFEWDEAKNLHNIKKHRIDFEAAKLVFAGPCLERLDKRRAYGEERVICVGAVRGLEIVVVYTWRGKTRRLISARRANDRERQAYRQALLRLESS